LIRPADGGFDRRSGPLGLADLRNRLVDLAAGVPTWGLAETPSVSGVLLCPL
jgi:hypothetical protein